MYHQLLQEKCLKPSGRLKLRDVWKRDLTSPRSERFCSHAEFPARSPRAGHNRGEERTGEIAARHGRCAAAPRERSLPLPSAPLFRARARVCPCAWEARGRGGPAAQRDSQPAASAPVSHPPRLNLAAALFAAGPGAQSDWGRAVPVPLSSGRRE